MKKDKLDAIGYLDDQLIEKAELYTSTNRKPLLRWMAIAACLLITIIGIFAIPRISDDTRSQDYAVRVVYKDAEYFVVSNNSIDGLFKDCGLPEIITEELAGKSIGYFEMGEKNIYHFVEGATAGHAVLFEYAPRPNDNVFIVQIDGKYYAAIRKDNEGYHGVYEEKKK